ncbi:hypothetical protein [Sphaerisporangium sp. TRM90804]|uniref:hypothetical protein n=1 Tax=Sphaerisporangium sp. TRM90804 TaxID=3031113 RepID=UPI002447D3F1|nr:hypothetical protein [Sphaerisporangium sp. TRM90804]MDH2424986.1 hypothetical protein [Sphaerisporangium sp. TRM90804]
MFERLVGVHVLRLGDVLNMSRVGSTARTASKVPALAILVLPREVPPHEPHLVLLTGASNLCAIPPGTLVAEGSHVVVHLDDGLKEAWPEAADVVVGAARRPYPFPAHRVTRILDRYPGCEVATSRRRRGCLAGLRDGRLAKVTEVGEPLAGTSPGPAVYGSFLYGWLVAGLPLGCLTTASVVHGRYAGPAAGGAGSLEVTGRAQITVAESMLRGARRSAP